MHTIHVEVASGWSFFSQIIWYLVDVFPQLTYSLNILNPILCNICITKTSRHFLLPFKDLFSLRSPSCLLLSLFSLCLALPSLSVPLLSCCLAGLLCDIHFNHFIMHLVGRRWALDGWKFIKGALITICPLKMALLILFTGGNNSLNLQTVWGLCCRSFAQTALALRLGKTIRIWASSLFYRFDSAIFISLKVIALMNFKINCKMPIWKYNFFTAIVMADLDEQQKSNWQFL